MQVFPTHVGLTGVYTPRKTMTASIPHARGVNRPGRCFPGSMMRIPTHVGVNRTEANADALRWVFPTHVGVNRSRSSNNSRSASIPHTRGGEPHKVNKIASMANVIPTHVGVNHWVYVNALMMWSIPHARGGDRCTGMDRWKVYVFPTHVGVNRVIMT